jgi:diguanylate cyclase
MSRRWLSRMVGSKPSAVWIAAVLFTGGGLGRLLVMVFPISPEEPAALDGGIGMISCVVGILLWRFAWKVPLVALEVLMGLSVLGASALVANAVTGRGVVLTAFAYPWIIVYGAHFFPRRVILSLGALISVSFGVGLMLNGLPGGGMDWVLVSGTVFTAGMVLGNLSENLRRQADTDHLTGLLNRSGLLAAATRERALADRTGSPLTLAVIDLDGFKQINDRDGHAAGDRLLESLGCDWRGCVRPGDIVARQGGDEFVLLLPSTTPTGAEGVLRRLRCREEMIRWSVGVSEWLPGESLDAPLARADRYLYRVKWAQRAERVEGPGVEDPAEGGSHGEELSARGALLPST